MHRQISVSEKSRLPITIRTLKRNAENVLNHLIAANDYAIKTNSDGNEYNCSLEEQIHTINEYTSQDSKDST